jgi:hypothetical protein
MSTLSGERCVACRHDSLRVTAAEIADLGREVSGWQLLERDGARLERAFHFPKTSPRRWPSPTGSAPSLRWRVTILPSSPSGDVSR